MIFKRYTNVHEFYKDTVDYMMTNEAQNVIPLGNIMLGVEGKDKTEWRDPANWFMGTVSGGDGLELVAVMTPPHNLTVYTKNNIIKDSVFKCLIEGLEGVHVPGIMAEKETALCFADMYCNLRQMKSKTTKELRIYAISEVNPDIEHIGEMRLLEQKDMHFFPFWLENFYASSEYGADTMKIPGDEAMYLHQISLKNIYVLEDQGNPVSIGRIHREMKTVCVVGLVYTPSYFRGRGYATSLTARITQAALDKGFKQVILYTDLANPTSNSIYQKIGYKPFCDSLSIKFEGTNS